MRKTFLNTAMLVAGLAVGSPALAEDGNMINLDKICEGTVCFLNIVFTDDARFLTAPHAIMPTAKARLMDYVTDLDVNVEVSGILYQLPEEPGAPIFTSRARMFEFLDAKVDAVTPSS